TRLSSTKTRQVLKYNVIKSQAKECAGEQRPLPTRTLFCLRHCLFLILAFVCCKCYHYGTLQVPACARSLCTFSFCRRYTSPRKCIMERQTVRCFRFKRS